MNGSQWRGQRRRSTKFWWLLFFFLYHFLDLRVFNPELLTAYAKVAPERERAMQAQMVDEICSQVIGGDEEDARLANIERRLNGESEICHDTLAMLDPDTHDEYTERHTWFEVEAVYGEGDRGRKTLAGVRIALGKVSYNLLFSSVVR